MIRAAAIVVLVAAIAGHARADETEADTAFRAAERRAAAGDPQAIDAFEALGAQRPTTRWTDDAWAEAARFAERAGDFARAQRDLEQLIAVASDEQVARRARADLERMTKLVGGAGQWSAVAAEHDRLVGRLLARGDPKPTLAALDQLLSQHPGYPRAAVAMIAAAQAWERDGDAQQAATLLSRAQLAAPDPVVRLRATAELARLAIRHEQFDDARVQIANIDDRVLAADLQGDLDRATRRRIVRWMLATLLLAIAVVGFVALRRTADSWRAALRRLARPPVEALFFAPIALVLIAVSYAGNPLVARAVRGIAVSGAVVTWLSGAILEGARAKHGRLRLRRAAAHAALAALTVATAAYLAVAHDRMLDLVAETWREGPAPR